VCVGVRCGWGQVGRWGGGGGGYPRGGGEGLRGGRRVGGGGRRVRGAGWLAVIRLVGDAAKLSGYVYGRMRRGGGR